MCLILFAFQQQPDYPLIIAANRDEFYDRPTQAAHFWPEAPELFAGKDLQAGGTWMGVTKGGRFAAVTNYRSAASVPPQAISRGQLCTEFLCSDISPEAYLAKLETHKDHYAGFNLLVGTTQQLFYYSNRGAGIVAIKPGVHGLSNGLLNDAWPKVEQGKIALRESLRHSTELESLLPILHDTEVAEAADLPATGVDADTERLLSSRFIRSDGYGTRSSAVLRMGSNKRTEWLEQYFDRDGIYGDNLITNIGN